MILPTKRVQEDRALLSLGAEIIRLLDEPKTVSRVWDEFRRARAKMPEASPVVFDWFVLALDLLYTLGAIAPEKGRLRRVSP